MAIQKFADGSSLDTVTKVVTDAQGVVHAPTENLPTPPSSNLNLPSITGSNASPSQGTDSIRGNLSGLDVLGNQVDNLTKETASSTDLAASLTELTAKRDALKTLTQDDLTAIDQAGTAAGLEYDPLITEAEKAKRFGMPKAIVGAGERGGLMNTQFAGAAALAPTEGGGWVGAGGELERIQSVYDDNISKIKATKEQAIAQAKIAARQAIRTGKMDDFNVAKSLYELARQSHQDEIDLASKKINAINSYNQEVRSQMTDSYNIIKSQQDIIEKIPAGQSWTTKNPFTGEDVTFEGSKLAKPFFTSAELTQIMLKLDKGETATFKDPNTGQDITLTGLINQTPKSQTFIDDKGYAHTIETATGKELSKSTTPVGKSKTLPTSVIINSETGLTKAQTTAAKAKYLTVMAPKGKTDKDFEDLSASEKLMWFGGGPEADPQQAEIQKVVNEQNDFLASVKGDWETAYNTLIGRDPNLGIPLTEADRQQIQMAKGFYPDPKQYETMADILLNKPKNYTK